MGFHGDGTCILMYVRSLCAEEHRGAGSGSGTPSSSDCQTFMVRDAAQVGYLLHL